MECQQGLVHVAQVNKVMIWIQWGYQGHKPQSLVTFLRDAVTPWYLDAFFETTVDGWNPAPVDK